ncbi:MAG: SGNH/GDSL hydrolase family protein, partial [Myxococcales bacterium]
MDGMAPRYVALGDSYAAGVGAGEHAGPCWRTDAGYPLEVARGLGEDLSWQACIGATVADVRREQLAALDADATHVSITVGGNDIGFAPVLVSAAQPAWMSDTDVVLDGALRLLREELPNRLRRLYADVRAAAPDAEILVTTYPR